MPARSSGLPPGSCVCSTGCGARGSPEESVQWRLCGACAFPCCDAARHDAKQGVNARRGDPASSLSPPRRPLFEFSQEVAPLELNLTPGHIDVHPDFAGHNPGGVEPVAARQGFGVHRPEILRHEANGVALPAETDQLRVADVAPCSAHQHGLGEQTFPPQRGQPASVQVFRVKTPQAHGGLLGDQDMTHGGRCAGWHPLTPKGAIALSLHDPRTKVTIRACTPLA